MESFQRFLMLVHRSKIYCIDKAVGLRHLKARKLPDTDDPSRYDTRIDPPVVWLGALPHAPNQVPRDIFWKFEF